MIKKNSEQLMDLIPKLTAVEFAGLARVLKVSLLDEVDPDAEQIKDRFAPRSFTAVLEDIFINFEKQSRKRRREIISIVKKAIKAEGDEDASSTEDSEG